MPGNIHQRSYRVLWLTAAVCAAYGLAATQAAGAAKHTIEFDATPARTVVAALDSRLHSHIILAPGIDAGRAVTFYVTSNTDTTLRQSALVALANQLGGDYAKSIIVAKADAKTPVRTPPIDDHASITFQSRRMSARQAITMIAGSDRADVHFRSPINGTVLFSANTLTLRQAAAEVAAQTHTTWTAVYVITPLAASPREARIVYTSPRAIPSGDRVIGHTADGAPITMSPPERLMHRTSASSAAPVAVTPDPYASGYQNGLSLNGAQTTLPSGETITSPNAQVLTPMSYYTPYTLNPAGAWYRLPNGASVTNGGNGLQVFP